MTLRDVRHWLFLARTAPLTMLGHWQAVDEHRVVLDVLLPLHRDTEAARTFWARLIGEFHVTETICTGKMARYEAAIRTFPVLDTVDHQHDPR